MVILILAANTRYLFLILIVAQKACISDQKKCMHQKFVQILSQKDLVKKKKKKAFWSAVTETTPEHWGWTYLVHICANEICCIFTASGDIKKYF